MSTAVDQLTSMHAWRGGISAVASGCLMFFGSTLGNLIYSAQTSDGTITSPVFGALYMAAFAVGAALLVRALIDVQVLHRIVDQELPRAGRYGARISVLGAGLLSLFGIGMLVTGLSSGAPLEILFVPFGLGMLLLIIGQTALSLGIRRAGTLGGWWRALLVGAVGALVAIVVFADPWHDLGLLTFNAAWVLLGAHMIRRARRRHS